jgi:hypothetical protein
MEIITLRLKTATPFISLRKEQQTIRKQPKLNRRERKMRNIKVYCSLFIFALLLTGCASLEKEKPLSNELIIEPYNVNDKESLLISRTGIEFIEYFQLNGTLDADDDLQFSVEVYKNGELEEELLNTSNEPKAKFKDLLISFGISDSNDKGSSLQLIAGIPSGLATTNFSSHMTSASFNKLLHKKIALKKNTPVYLAAWVGTTKNVLRSVDSENGKLPKGIKEVEAALLYRVLLTDKKK